ncbi:MAG: hypothetical protein QW751_01670 [Candidatus Aenigmatarchaeota archaeon]|nr:hypothetical protein [Candidatus Aenigmarchaeota archaeon]
MWSKRCKGITLLGELIAFMFMIGMGYFLGGLVLYMDNISGGLKALHIGPINYTLTVKSGYVPISQEAGLLALMEVTDPTTGMPLKKLLAAAVAQDSDTVWIEGKTRKVSAAFTSALVTSGWIPTLDEKTFLIILKTRTQTIKLWDKNFDKTGNVIILQKVRYMIPSLNGNGYIEMYIRGTNLLSDGNICSSNEQCVSGCCCDNKCKTCPC